MSKVKLNLFSETLLSSSSEMSAFSEASGSDGKRQYYIEGIFAQANSLNRNRRIYPEEVLFPDIARYNENFVKRKLAWGELDHPEKRVIVNMNEVSHLITSLTIDGSNVYGKAIIANTPKGNIVRNLIDIGGQLAVSTRGLGKSVEFSDHELMEIYHMTAIDIVSHPSGIDCFVNGVAEGVDYLVESSLLSKMDAYKIISSNDKEVSTRDFRKVINSILKDM
ncbi:prohead core scaffolding protein and protease [Rhizobium phage P9VFCI]|uniref:Prohead core scaffolding protein and protease n=2 Tax=Innesvirus TaxID=3044739 RepID=A0A7G7WX95_9CAUD|nr:head maturation protease [Rhizobium phage P9VFCI]YP_010662268.1 head maturation protease [Rhizobium phage AF3]QNH71422.1 prohead assembly (scaffolding) protein [Rhizobium phage AF3]QNH71839.1 prohead core scaffolding protein and protease [Rhizobium phage P9VFCI]